MDISKNVSINCKFQMINLSKTSDVFSVLNDFGIIKNKQWYIGG